MTSMTIHTFKVIEYDPDQPWVIVSTSRGSIELPEGDSFDAWASETYPDGKRWKIVRDRTEPTPFSRLKQTS